MIDETERRRLLEAARDAARAAGAAILEIYAGDFAVRQKDDRTPVTLADERAEAIIIAALYRAAPQIPAVAEEEMAAGGAAPHPPERFWLVDPLDGTREFIRRNGEFTVNIALVEDGRCALGVVHVPVTNITYWGMGLGTAMRQVGDAPPAGIHARRAPATGAVVAHSRSHGDSQRVDAYVAGIPGAVRRVSGSSVKFCLIAAGEADYYPRFGPTMEWDTAAGQAVLEAAGGAVMTLDGAPLRYAKPEFRNPDFIARGAA
ncbi:MAG TPA: 3'(2'),5'-bisphosphate nucleotidase CysQ [Stellaceae bacterium]|nr:3'(2'),5'-bisphosphate nucleotidase CysQ [Stellaceae bacterium]